MNEKMQELQQIQLQGPTSGDLSRFSMIINAFVISNNFDDVFF